MVGRVRPSLFTKEKRGRTRPTTKRETERKAAGARGVDDFVDPAGARASFRKGQEEESRQLELAGVTFVGSRASAVVTWLSFTLMSVWKVRSVASESVTSMLYWPAVRPSST